MIGYDIIHGGIVEGFWVGPILEDCTTWSYGNDTTVFQIQKNNHLTSHLLFCSISTVREIRK